MMEDFNAAMASMESGMTATAADSAQAVSTANAAHAIAQQTAGAAYTPANKPYVVGTYIGDGTTAKDIHLGFRPSFVIGCSSAQLAGDGYTAGRGMFMTGETANCERIILTDTGFRVSTDESLPVPTTNQNGLAYDYIAFR